MSIHSTFFTHTFYFAHWGSTPREGQIININDMELTLTTTDINIMDVFKKSRERRRIDYLRVECKRVFDGMVHKCCGITRNNPQITYVIHRSVLGYPRVEVEPKRLNDVTLHESDNCVIVQDGYAYELTKRVE